MDLAVKVDAIDRELGRRLRHMVGNLQYAELLEVLDKSVNVRSA